MPYHQMEDKEAKEFCRKNCGYNLYECDLVNSILRRNDDGFCSSSCLCSYLVNSQSDSLDFQEICRRNDKYDVIFISPSDYSSIL